METLIKNQAILNGLYGSDNMLLESTNADVTLIDGLTATKIADRTLWASGNLKYTVTIENTTDVDYETPIFTDELDALIVVVSNSVKIGEDTVQYTFLDHVLTVNLPTIEGGETVVVTFLVQRATP